MIFFFLILIFFNLHRSYFVKQNFNTNLNYFFSNLWNSCVSKIKYNMYKVQDYDMALFTILLTILASLPTSKLCIDRFLLLLLNTQWQIFHAYSAWEPIQHYINIIQKWGRNGTIWSTTFTCIWFDLLLKKLLFFFSGKNSYQIQVKVTILKWK
jgi:hypothetical protein